MVELIEEWRDVVGYEKEYQVSSIGRLRSNDMVYELTSPKKGRIMKLSTRLNGYLYATLCKNNKCRKHNIHRLAAEAFVSNPDNKPQVNHKDGIKRNNIADNLEWVTQLENISHSIKTGLKPRISKLTDGDIIKIRQLLREGVKVAIIRKLHYPYIGQTALYNIKSGIRFKYVNSNK
jgi:hypothetical protein